MKRNIIIVILLIGVGLTIYYLTSKKNNNDFYKETNQVENIDEEINKDITEELNNGNNTEYTGESIKEVLKEDNNYSDKDKKITEELGLKFIPLVHGYDLDNKHKDKVVEATKYTTESMESFIIGTFVDSKQPILYSGFYAREVSKIKAVEPKISEDSIIWEYEVKSKILNRNKEIINEERNRVNLVFIKENDEWKVGNYSTTQYRE